MDNKKYAILILAAGHSKRLGRPKQLIPWKKTTLLNHTIGEATKIENVDIYVALGGNQSEVRPTIVHGVNLLNIPDWYKGMGTTISSSLLQIDTKIYRGIILSVCDQPFISFEIFNELIKAYEHEKAAIVVAKYQQASGPPTFFSSKYFNELLNLRGEEGAKELVKKNFDEVTSVSFPYGYIDIDTETDVSHLSMLTKKT